MFEPLLADRERILGPDNPATLSTGHDLALALALARAYQIAGRTDDAECVQQRTGPPRC